MQGNQQYKKRILIVSAGLPAGEDFLQKNRFDEILSFSELVRMPMRKLFQFLRTPKEIFFIKIGDREKYLYVTKTLLFLANAKEKGTIDREGNITTFGAFDYAKMFIQLFFDIVAASTFIILLWAFLLFLNVWLALRSGRACGPTSSTSKKVVFLRTDADTGSRVGGSYSHIAGFTGGLQGIGYEVVFLGDYLPLEHPQSSQRFFRIPLPKFFHIPELPEFLYNFTFFFRGLPILKREKPIAFLYHRNSFANCTGVFLAKLLRVPLIYEFNGSEAWARQYWGGRLFFKRLAYLFEDICFRGADIIAVVSQVIKDDLMSKGVSSSKIIVNPNGVDPDIFSPALSGASVRAHYGFEGKIVVGFVGTFGPWHGADMLAKTIKQVVGQNQNVRFLFVGDGATRSKVEEIVVMDGVEKFVTIAGVVTHEKMPEYLAACDILVSPTIPNEDGSRFFGSPTKLFEYMAMSKAIVASNLEQIGQILKHEETALLTEPGDANDLAHEISRFAQDEALRKRLGAAARASVEREYTWKMNAQRVIDAFLALHSFKKE